MTKALYFIIALTGWWITAAFLIGGEKDFLLVMPELAFFGLAYGLPIAIFVALAENLSGIYLTGLRPPWPFLITIIIGLAGFFALLMLGIGQPTEIPDTSIKDILSFLLFIGPPSALVVMVYLLKNLD